MIGQNRGLGCFSSPVFRTRGDASDCSNHMVGRNDEKGFINHMIRKRYAEQVFQ
jgi:hypothetical protein